MGTTGIKQTMKETREMLVREFSFSKEDGSYSKVLAKAIGKGGLWILREINYIESMHIPSHFKGITATWIKMFHDDGMTYYKEFDIDCHPFQYDVPENWIDRITPSSKDGEEWLAKAKKLSENPKDLTGVEFKLQEREMKVLKKIEGTIWWLVFDSTRGCNYRMRTSVIKDQL